ncbi:MAG: COX15/CtaA family protein [Bdellovibrionales bacterium]|nr:COX15/CtaA family protein [Bdellovibrionales bacterium]
MKYFKPLSLGLYLYTLLVILWGAWVRISKSGDGCGDSWPLCDGKVIPSTKSLATWIEFSHRLTTGLFGIFVVVLCVMVLKNKSSNVYLKRVAKLSVLFTISEALLGAALVKFGLVTDNDSFLRLFVMGLHQVNSLLLSGFIGLCIIFYKSDIKVHWSMIKTLLCSCFLLLAATGAIASLSTTLHPSTSLLSGLQADLFENSHWIIKWRSIHPILATVLGGTLLYVFILQGAKTGFTKELKDLIRLFAVGLIFGALTLTFLSPMWMKLTHLLLAHLLWLFLLRYLVQVISKLSANGRRV